MTYLKSSLGTDQPTAAERIESGEGQDQYWTSDKGLDDVDNVLEVQILLLEIIHCQIA